VASVFQLLVYIVTIFANCQLYCLLPHRLQETNNCYCKFSVVIDCLLLLLMLLPVSRVYVAAFDFYSDMQI